MSIVQRRPFHLRLWYGGVVILLGVVLLGGGQPPASAPPPSQPAAPQPMGQGAAGGTGVSPVGTSDRRDACPTASPMDEPLRLITQARQAYQGVRDYSCLLIKRESVNGAMSPDNVVDMRVRTQPFSVYLHWQQPRHLAGQEACYVAGRYDGKMRVRPTGVLGAVGFVSLDPNDPRARQHSRHNISEAGIGNLIERFARGWEAERQANMTQVRVAEYEYNHRRCTRVETVHPTNPQGQFLYYRSVLFFDKETHLPIRLECYDWPRRQGDPGQLVEMYSFANMRINVGLGDDVFNH